MSESVGKVLAGLVLFATPIVLLSAANAQIKANCTFHLFKSPGIPLGVNDYGTTVGQANSKGFVRHSNGTVSYFQAPTPRGRLSLLATTRVSL